LLGRDLSLSDKALNFYSIISVVMHLFFLQEKDFFFFFAGARSICINYFLYVLSIKNRIFWVKVEFVFCQI